MKTRKEYLSGVLNESECPEEPIVFFEDWFNQAMNKEHGEPNAFSLSTVSSEGQPHSRILLLKEFINYEFIFATNYKSQKAKDIENNNLGAMLFFWQKLERQVRIQGSIFKVTKEQSKDIFNKRPHGSKAGAYASFQSSEISSRAVLEENHKIYLDKQNLECPEFWGGYKLIPNYFEFWQGRENRLHDRIVYKLDNTKWVIKRLSP